MFSPTGYVAIFKEQKADDDGHPLFFTKTGLPATTGYPTKRPIIGVNAKGESQVLDGRGKRVTLNQFAAHVGKVLDEVEPADDFVIYGE